jgi:hypothetical protein
VLVCLLFVVCQFWRVGGLSCVSSCVVVGLALVGVGWLVGLGRLGLACVVVACWLACIIKFCVGWSPWVGFLTVVAVDSAKRHTLEHDVMRTILLT